MADIKLCICIRNNAHNGDNNAVNNILCKSIRYSTVKSDTRPGVAASMSCPCMHLI